MLRELVKQTWGDWHGSLEPIALEDLENVRREVLTTEALRRGAFKAGDGGADDILLEHTSRPLADKFQVSAEAMRIRLENMGLLLRKKEASLF